MSRLQLGQNETKMTTKRKKSRKGLGKGIPKQRTVFGRRRFVSEGNTYVIEMRSDAIHVRQLFTRDTRNPVTFLQVLDFSDPQLMLISAHGSGLPEGEQAVNHQPKESNGNEKRQDTEGSKTTETPQAAQAAGPA